MKLFQKLLLAPAALGLFAPVVANANESNFRDVTSYSQQVDISTESFKPLSNKNPLLAGGEGSNQSSSGSDNFDVDTFSSTTTASFTVNAALGKVDGLTPAQDKLGLNFDWEAVLSSSFTGNDSLDVVLNAGVSNLFTELDMTNTSKAQLQVDTISYTRSFDRVSAFFASGDGVAGSGLYNTACVYGAQADTLSNCGVSAANIDEGLGTALGVSFNFENGLSFALGYEGQGMVAGEVGLLAQNGADAFGGQLAYTGDSYGVSISWANIDNHSDANVRSTGATQSTGINAYYAPDLANFPSLSIGLETLHDDSITGTALDEKSMYFFGLQWDEFVGDGSFGAALGSKVPTPENSDAVTMYEVYYSYNYADGITITPLIYSKDKSGTNPSETGVVVKTELSF